MVISRLTQPAVEPVTLQDAKTQCRVLDNAEDAYLVGLISVAREFVEQKIGRTLIRSDFVLTAHKFPCGAIELPEPVSTIVSVSYKDAALATQTISLSDLEFEEGALTPALSMITGKTWPATADRLNAVKVTYTAGYGVDSNAVPAPIKQAMLLLIAHLFANREQTTATALTEIPNGVPALLAYYTTRRIH